MQTKIAKLPRWLRQLIRFLLEIAAIFLTLVLQWVAAEYCPRNWVFVGFGVSFAIGFRAWKWAEDFQRSRTITALDIENDPELAAAVITIGSRVWGDDKPSSPDVGRAGNATH